MRILTLDHLRDLSTDVTFAPTRVTPVVLCMIFVPLLLLDVTTAFVSVPVRHLFLQILWISTPLLLAGAAIGGIDLYATLRSTFWLCRVRGNAMWIRCSTEPDSLVIELDRSDLIWAQPLRVLDVWDWAGPRLRGRDYRAFRYLELGLTPSAATLLDDFIRDERISKTARETIAPPATILNMPARMVRPDVLRLYWRGISPGLNHAGKLLSKWVEVRPIRRESLSNS
jgi:hypothetical protein